MGFFKAKGKHAQGRRKAEPKDQLDSAASEEAKTVDAVENSAPELEDQTIAIDAVADEATTRDALDDETSAIGSPDDEASAIDAPVDEDAAVDSPADETLVLDVPSEANFEDAPIESDGMKPLVTFSGFPAVTSDGIVLEKKRQMSKAVGITFGVVIGVLLIAYIVGAVVFMGRMFPNTTIGDIDVSMLSNEEAAAAIDGAVADYKLEVVGTDFNYGLTAEDINLKADSAAIVESVHEDLSPWTWPARLLQDSHDQSDKMVVAYDKGKYTDSLKKAVEEYNKEATEPVDATIGYDEKTSAFVVIPEVAGTQYDADAVLNAMGEAIDTLNPKVKLTSASLIQPKVFSTDERLVESAELATGLTKAHVTLKMGNVVAAEIDGSDLSDFIKMDENLNVTLDEEALDKWVTDLSNGFDTVGSTRTYTRADGKEITVSGGAYGWSTDAASLKEEVVEAVKSGATTTIDIPCEQTAAVYNGAGKPDWGNRYIDVDISEQYVRFYGDDGSIIWESACISGTPDGEHNTWPGVWYVTNKQSPSKLIGYLPNGKKEYETMVSYWMAFEGNGIGLHDATWQPAFGGSMYANGYGSHGCVNLPYDAAQSLYGLVQVGDCVIVHS